MPGVEELYAFAVFYEKRFDARKQAEGGFEAGFLSEAASC